ncbi:DUF2514 family protein [Pseudomonas cremoricolorata]|uniref:DUF2514 family protein n=1 Tax=Pseudomonas cremoricolorata TaxID=157783 RepID=UPI000400763C|nr:DUF2514 family protein [Pseudomonas cremoricolorata]
MSGLPAVPAWALWLAALGLLGGVQQLRLQGAQTQASAAQQQLLDYRRAVAEDQRLAAQRALAELQRRQRLADQEAEDARRTLQDIEDRAATAESAADGLRGEIARLRAGRSATCAAITAQQRPAGATAVVVLGQLLEDADRMAGSLAAALERSRVAGEACQAIYRKMTRGGD